ncbi:potassium voltage-gated channel interacting protein 1 [Phyllostomus discolor]|uniref:Potassium voltage-gated channel interacting protein 1 n=1 Tax=Phyllostomus discolor TaxID=89673 RepID=A0A834DIR0_9CHIR|nr:potassium voltage-gated channel interacting protein 1 [Phyllostomus discolor]
MSGCSKRCKLGFVKFAQTIFKLITGTLSKGEFVKSCCVSLAVLLGRPGDVRTTREWLAVPNYKQLAVGPSGGWEGAVVCGTKAQSGVDRVRSG